MKIVITILVSTINVVRGIIEIRIEHINCQIDERNHWCYLVLNKTEAFIPNQRRVRVIHYYDECSGSFIDN